MLLREGALNKVLLLNWFSCPGAHAGLPLAMLEGGGNGGLEAQWAWEEHVLARAGYSAAVYP